MLWSHRTILAAAPCPRPSRPHTARRRWLQSSYTLACLCTARFRGWLLAVGGLGIAGFCAAWLGLGLGALSEPQYLASVLGSLALFAGSALITRLGDPYEYRRSERRRSLELSRPSRALSCVRAADE